MGSPASSDEGNAADLKINKNNSEKNKIKKKNKPNSIQGALK